MSETFEDMDLDDKLLRGIFSHGFEKPSNIQSKSITILKSGKDLVAQSQSGTGKTGAFVIGSLSKLDINNNNVQIIILSPTRELAIQIYNVAKNISQYQNFKIELLIGGNMVNNNNIRNNLKNTHMIIGTPGKIYDLINRNILKINNLKTIVLDEADELLSKDFKEQFYDILKFINDKIQIVLYSATISNEITSIIDNILDDPVKILIQNEQLTLEGIQQYYINTMYDKNKLDTLLDIYSDLPINQTIIYVNSINRAYQLHTKLKYQNFDSSLLHSKLEQKDRNNILNDFRNGTTRILISTDIISRGIDIQSVSIIINYDIPNKKETYIHRIGRSGRYGRKGVAINFCNNNDIEKLKNIESFYSTIIDELPSNYKEIIM